MPSSVITEKLMVNLSFPLAKILCVFGWWGGQGNVHV